MFFLFKTQILKVKPITLEGKYALLCPPPPFPQSINDLDVLSSAAQDGKIWNNPYALFSSIGEMSEYLQGLLKDSKTILPFIIIHKQSNKIAGTTRYLNIDYDNYRLEIDHTWIAQSYRRTAVITESKFLMLQHVFEKLNCIAVVIRTDVLNEVSRKDIERLGAKQDGYLENPQNNEKWKNQRHPVHAVLFNLNGHQLKKRYYKE